MTSAVGSAVDNGAIIGTDGLTREFRVRDGRRRRLLTAVDGLTVRIEPGEAVGYIGANSAGKSTTIKMLTGILVPTAGRVLTCGLRPVPDRRRLARQVGVVFGQRSASAACTAPPCCSPPTTWATWSGCATGSW